MSKTNRYLKLNEMKPSEPILACRYSHIPGVKFSDNYAPVVNDTIFQMLIVVLNIFALSAKMIADVETAFLHGVLEEEISWNAHLKCQEHKYMKSSYFKNAAIV